MEKKFCFLIKRKEGWRGKYKSHYITVVAHKITTARKKAKRFLNGKGFIVEEYIEYKNRGD